MKFRTRYNPGNYTDYEHYEPGTSLTEPGQAETMQQLMERMQRFPNRPVDLSELDVATVDELLDDANDDELISEGRTGIATALDAMEADFAANQSEEVAEAKDEKDARTTRTTTSAADEQVPVSRRDGDQASSDVTKPE